MIVSSDCFWRISFVFQFLFCYGRNHDFIGKKKIKRTMKIDIQYSYIKNEPWRPLLLKIRKKHCHVNYVYQKYIRFVKHDREEKGAPGLGKCIHVMIEKVRRRKPGSQKRQRDAGNETKN
jgi:hypothetical protein